jgi:hypothetical protein
MSAMLDRDKFENITKQVKALGAEFVRQYRTEFLRQCRTEFMRQDRVTTALDIAHERARQCLQNSLPARPGAF